MTLLTTQTILAAAARPGVARGAPPGRAAAVLVRTASRRGTLRAERRQLVCRAEDKASAGVGTEVPAEVPAATPAPPAEAEAAGGSTGIALGSVAAGVLLFAATRLGGPVGLEDLAANAVPLDVALSNGRPTVLEFYADWCEVCREMAPSVYSIEKEYQDDVNFVMINIDNTKWTPELTEYGVGGIPHFVFLDPVGAEQGTVIGRLPAEILEGNTAALKAAEPLPFAKKTGQTSSLGDAPRSSMQGPSDPRAHGY